MFFLDETHLLWGDICGYVWGKKKQRIEVPIINERQQQTYYGALNIYTQQGFVKAYAKGNSEYTIAFLQSLLTECAQRRIAVIWDGASYHRSGEVKAYLESVNQGRDESSWKITCLRFAERVCGQMLCPQISHPNAPEQNPIEDVWLQAKQFIRKYYHLCSSFSAVKQLFEFMTHHQIFDFPKLSMYSSFS